jgi:phospholipid/cholesterol/gamma-HCH transport system permease protein
VLDQIGEATIRRAPPCSGLIGFFGAVLISCWIWRASAPDPLECDRPPVRGGRRRGARIIGLMSFLIGIVIAQQGAIQLRQFGAEVFTINLVGRLTLRELGVLMTAIMVAGRSGSAFAAQIGSMRLAEEVDAMRTIGVAPMEALIMPRIIAGGLMMPLLAFYAAMVGLIGGGLFCWTVARHPADHLRRPHPRSRPDHRSLAGSAQGAGVRA